MKIERVPIGIVLVGVMAALGMISWWVWLAVALSTFYVEIR